MEYNVHWHCINVYSALRQIKQKYDCFYHFPIDLEPNGVHGRDWGWGNGSEEVEG